MLVQETIEIMTSGRGTTEFTAQLQRIAAASGIRRGICHVFIHHTSASLMLCENADPAVLRDLETFMTGLAPDGDPRYTHTAEGPDDMPAHVRSVLTQTGLDIPVADRRCDLGTWQGAYVWEHRHRPHRRRLTVTIHGE